MKYQLKTFRNAGLEARWSRTRKGAPIVTVRNPAAKTPHQRTTWWTVDVNMWESMQKDGIVEAFDSHTLLGDLFSVKSR